VPAIPENVPEVVRIDLRTGNVQRFREGDWAFSEPVFIGTPGRTREAEGVLLTVGSARTRSALFALDADTLDVRARVTFDVPLPLGFHGNFVAAPTAGDDRV
jgi:carotenoid cleavage dioxygenase-like enzyme